MIFMKAAKEGVDLPPVARGFLLMLGAKLSRDRRAVVLAASGQHWEFDKVATALRATFPKLIPEPGHGIHLVEEGRERPSVSVPEPVANPWASPRTDAEEETLAIINESDAPMDEETVVEVLAGWNQSQLQAGQERLKRGFGSSQKTSRDVKAITARVRCDSRKKLGHFSRNCPLKVQQKTSASSTNLGVMYAVDCLASGATTEEPCNPITTEEVASLRKVYEEVVLEKLTQKERFKRLARERRETDDEDEYYDQPSVSEVCMCHDAGCAIPSVKINPRVASRCEETSVQRFRRLFSVIYRSLLHPLASSTERRR